MIKNIPIFNVLDKHELAAVEKVAKAIEYPAHHVFVHEGDGSHVIYLVLSGEVQIFKSRQGEEHVIATLRSESLIGETALMDSGLRNADVRTVHPTRLLAIDLRALRKDAAYQRIQQKLLAQLSHHLMEKLQSTNETTVKVLENQLSAARMRLYVGEFMVTLLAIVALYTLLLEGIVSFSQYTRTSSLASVGIILVLALSFCVRIYRSHFRWAEFGFTLKDSRVALIENLYFTVLFLLWILVSKWIFLWWVGALETRAVIEPSPALQALWQGELTQPFLYLALYVLFCPVQEFIGRGALQGTLSKFLMGSHRSILIRSVLISNLLFAMAHAHLGFGIAMTVLIPGVFWGWLYYRHRTLLGVSISHMIVGTVSFFVVGLEGIVL